LRDIEACLSAEPAKLYHMGFREPVRRSTLADPAFRCARRMPTKRQDANESRDWRIYAEFAQRLIAQARRLYAHESLGMDLTNTVYALDSTTIDLCMSVFPWAHFRSTKSAVKMHTLRDLRGNIPSSIHISDGELHDVHALDRLIPEPGAIYVMDRGYIDFARLHTLHQAGAFFVTRAKSNLTRIGSIQRPPTGPPASSPIKPSHWMVLVPARTTRCFCDVSDSAIPKRPRR
jgi:phage gp37-like protein